jgi:hypothetical protein
MRREFINMINLRVPFAALVLWATSGVVPGLAQPSAQPGFQSAAEASRALFQAVQTNNEEVIAKILGGPTELTSSRDAGQDKIEREMFVEKYQEMHRLSRDADGSVTLYIGAENWPFPIPLVANGGAWRFDPEAGAKEVTFRRIGDNELAAIATCYEFVTAAKHSRADPNSMWPANISPASLAAKAANGSADTSPVLLHGYYFRVLSPQGAGGRKAGRFILLAYPAEYRSSGVMTFVVTESNIVYEKDLGANTSALAGAMSAIHRDGTWRVAAE